MSLYSSASTYAKDTWLPVFPNQMSSSEGSLLQLLGLNTDERVKLEGRKWYMKIQTGTDTGFSMVPTQGGDLATPGDIAAKEATLDLKRFSEAIQFDAWEMALLDSLSAAAAPIMAKKMSEAKDNVMRQIERMAIMDGTGQIGKVASVSGTTFTFDVTGNAYPERNPYTWNDDPGRMYFRIVDPTDGTDQLSTPARFYFSSINESANTAVASATLTGAAAGDMLVLDAGQYGFSDSGHTTYTSPEFTGLLGMIDDSNTYLGLSRSANPQWKATVLANSGTLRDITDNLVHQLINRVGRRSTSGTFVPGNYFALADPGVWTSYHNLISTGLRYSISDNPDIGWGGRQVISMDGVPLYKHMQAPRHQILLVNKDKTGFVGPQFDTSSIVQFLDNSGSIFYRQTAASGAGYADSVIAYIAGFIGMYTERPRNHGRLDDLNLTAPAYDGQ